MKFSDDTVLLTLLQGSESDQGCCMFTGVTKIDLNVNKTKDPIGDLRKNSGKPKPNVFHGNKVEIVLRN